MEFHNPDSIGAPLGAYTHGILCAPNTQYIHISGQVGVDADGKVVDGIEAQCDWAWRNITAILKSAGMDVTNIVKMTSYLIDTADGAALRAVRGKYLGDHRPASTLLYISALATPDLRVEIEVVAGKEV